MTCMKKKKSTIPNEWTRTIDLRYMYMRMHGVFKFFPLKIFQYVRKKQIFISR